MVSYVVYEKEGEWYAFLNEDPPHVFFGPADTAQKALDGIIEMSEVYLALPVDPNS